MRFVIGLVLAFGFLLGGLVPIAGGFDMMTHGVTGDDVLAAFFIGGMLELIGVLILYAVIKARGRRKQSDEGMAGGTTMGLMIASSLDDAGADDSDDFAG